MCVPARPVRDDAAGGDRPTAPTGASSLILPRPCRLTAVLHCVYLWLDAAASAIASMHSAASREYSGAACSPPTPHTAAATVDTRMPIPPSPAAQEPAPRRRPSVRGGMTAGAAAISFVSRRRPVLAGVAPRRPFGLRGTAKAAAASAALDLGSCCSAAPRRLTAPAQQLVCRQAAQTTKTSRYPRKDRTFRAVPPSSWASTATRGGERQSSSAP
jgi:hypothetical protein